MILNYLYEYSYTNSINHKPICIKLPKISKNELLTEIYFIVKPNVNNSYTCDLILSEIFVDWLTCEQLCYIINNLSELLKPYKLSKYVFIFGLPINKKTLIYSKSYDSQYLIRTLCDVRNLNIKNSVLRNIKKSIQKLNFTSKILSYNDFKNSLKLIQHADYKYLKLSEQDIINLWNFYCQDNGIMITAFFEENIVGCMFGSIINNKAYMIIHYYDSKFNNFFINDGLYYNFIDFCKRNMVDIVDFGTCHINNRGLINMKKKYSTNLQITYVCRFKI